MVTVNISLGGTGTLAPTVAASLSYTLDGTASGSAPISYVGTAAISLGQLAPGAHRLSYSYPGDDNYPAATFSFSFQVSDPPFRYLGSSVMILYNTGDVGHAAVDSRDNTYFSDRSNNVIHKRDTHGNLTTYPVTGLNTPQGLAFDSADNLYIADQGNSRIVKVTPAGVQTTLPINISTSPLNLTFDNTRQNLYITDMPAQSIFVFNLASSAVTVFKDKLYNIFDVAFDASGALYYTQRYSYSPGTLTKLSLIGAPTSIQTPLLSPGGMVLDKTGNLYVTDFGSGGVWMMTPGGNFQQLTNIGSEAIAMDSRGVLYLPAGNSYAYSTQPAAYAGQSIAFPAGGGFFAGGTSVADASPTVYYTSSSTEWLSSLTFPTPSSPFRTYAGVTCIGNRLCYEPFVNSFVHPGPQSDYVVAASNLGTQLTTPVYGTGINSQLAFSPGTTLDRLGWTLGSFTFVPHNDIYGDIFGTSPGSGSIFANLIYGGYQKSVRGKGSAQAPTQIAGDAQRNVYYLESGTSRILRGSGGLGSDVITPDPTFNATVVFDLSAQTALHTLTSFALDTATNLWIGGADASGNGAILLQDPRGNRKVFASGIGVPVAMTVDGFGVLYSVDAGGTLRNFDAVGNPTTLAVNLLSPLSIAVEPSGVVYVANGVGDLVEVKPDGSTATLPLPANVATSVAFVTFDLEGNLTVGTNDSFGQILTIDRTHSPGYSFGNVTENTGSSVVAGQLINTGNLPLSFSALPGSGPFVQSATGNTCTTGTVLAPGGQCDLNFTFHPTSVQSYSQTGYIVDSTGGASAANSQFAVTFTGTGAASAPVLSVPGTITAEATAASGAAVTFTASATDAVDGTDPVTCVPASGSTFALGTATVACTATNHAGSSASKSFSVVVRDTTAPTLTLPGNLTIPATGTTGAVVTFTASSTDAVDGTDPVSCLPASGSTFAMGVTTVSCSSMDHAGNTARGTFTVTVQDNVPPVLTLPANITVSADFTLSAVVTYTASARDAIDGVRPVSCSPASGSTFGVGATTVTCSASDLSGNTATGTFSVTVQQSSKLVTLQTNLPLAGISVDGGAAQPSPLLIPLSFGAHTIAVAGALSGTQTQYLFTGWSDGGGASHSITVGVNSAVVYTATFKTQYLFTTVASPLSGGSVTATQYVDAGASIPVTATASPGFVFAGFSGSAAGTANPVSVPVTGPATVIANFTAVAPSLTASVVSKADGVPGSTRVLVLSLSNTGLGTASHATITSVSAQLLLGTGAVATASPLPVALGTIAPGASASTNPGITFNWVPTATKVKLTVNFTADNGYSGSTTITTLR
jgi:sugar lactone lactonase YvrE